MGQSQRVRLRDLRDVYRLIGECQDVGADPVEWRRTMLLGACRLIDAPLAMCGEGRWVGPAGSVRRFEFIWGPINVGPFDPNGLRFFAEHARDNRTHEDAISSPPSRIREALGFDHTAFSGHAVVSEYGVAGPDEVNMISLARTAGDQPFSARERRLLHIFHHELGPLIGGRLARGRNGDRRPLSPRLRQTLDRLLDGYGEKQVARRLGLSLPTVHQYITELYRRYGVSSRAELMARWVQRRAAATDD